MMGGRLQSFLNRLEIWFSQAKTTNAEDQLKRPPEWVTHLVRQELRHLQTPTFYIEAIREQVNDAVNLWQTQLDAENCLVLLGSPVDGLEQALHDSLKDWQPDTKIIVNLHLPELPMRRCRDPLAIPAQLHNQFGPQETIDKSLMSSPGSFSENNPASLESLDDRQTVVVIPALEQCFLRCIQGWEGIEYLQHLVTQDRSRFWVIGCNAWAWAFLDRVCRINAYLERAESLPRMDGVALHAWLRSLAEPLVPARPEDDDEPTLESSNSAASGVAKHQAGESARGLSPSSESPAAEPKTQIGSDSYWNALANLSGGISTTAAYLWVRSLRLRAETITDTFKSMDPSSVDSMRDFCDEVNLEFELVKPTLPGLSRLDALDRYLLHSLLMHGPMSREHLTQSLGETERLVRTRVQVLKRAGVIVQQQGELTVNAIHYPKLRSELSNNNFLIGEV
jgi:hypothetical protein